MGVKAIEVTREEFERYVMIQERGQYNILDPRARLATGLSKETYKEILMNYGTLQQRYFQSN